MKKSVSLLLKNVNEFDWMVKSLPRYDWPGLWSLDQPTCSTRKLRPNKGKNKKEKGQKEKKNQRTFFLIQNLLMSKPFTRNLSISKQHYLKKIISWLIDYFLKIGSKFCTRVIHNIQLKSLARSFWIWIYFSSIFLSFFFS